MTQQITSLTFGPPPEDVQKWCDRWNKLATKAGVSKTKLFGRFVGRQGVRGTSQLSLLQIGKEPLTYSFRGEEPTEDMMRSVTAALMVTAGITAQFDF
jgi:hypothetical protein